MRLAYTDNPPTGLPADDQAILERVQARRAPRGLIPLDLALLHAPKIADGWNALLGAVRTKSTLSAAIREIAICRVALLNEAWFEWNAHRPILEEAAGFTKEKLAVVKKLRPSAQGALTAEEWAVLKYADEMTREVKVSDATFQELKACGFSEQEMVEITATVASYNMVSRFLVALDVGECNGKVPDMIAKIPEGSSFY